MLAVCRIDARGRVSRRAIGELSAAVYRLRDEKVFGARAYFGLAETLGVGV